VTTKLIFSPNLLPIV